MNPIMTCQQIEPFVQDGQSKVRINLNDGVSHCSLVVNETEAQRFELGRQYTVSIGHAA